MAVKLCPGCKKTKPVEDFAVDKSKKSGRFSRCKPCDAARAKRYYAANAEKRRTYFAEKAAERDYDRSALVLAAERIYGAVCVVCGTKDRLHFDHVNGDGRDHRRVERPMAMIRRIVTLGQRLQDVELQLLCREHHHEKTLSEGGYGKRYRAAS